MKAEDLRELLEAVKCWPPICHACGNNVAPEAEVALKPSDRYESDRFHDPKARLLGLVHKGCMKRKLVPPARAAKGAFVTAGAIEGRVP